MLDIDAFVGALTLEPVDDDRYRAANIDLGHQVLFGGQLLAQSVIAGVTTEPGKAVKTVHTVFARSGAPGEPVEIDVDRLHSGRAMASCTVTIRQGDRAIARSQVLLSTDEPDFIRHGDSAPAVASPEESRAGRELSPAWEVRTATAADVSDPNHTSPPDLDVWTRFVGAPDDPAVSQALLAFATDGFLIGTAMLPHAGVGQSQAHVTVSTGVLSHTITFHEPSYAGDWHLLSHHSNYAGHGRAYGRADIFRQDGALVASFVQDAMIRPMNAAAPGKL
jgi:acyl-CoA thioesterase II